LKKRKEFKDSKKDNMKSRSFPGVMVGNKRSYTTYQTSSNTNPSSPHGMDTKKEKLPPNWTHLQTSSTTYLGKKGYTLSKKEMTTEQLAWIKETLTVRPKTMANMMGQVEKVYYIYRESTTKLYVPRYFGIQTFGSPSHICLSEGETISVSFRGNLREQQIPAVHAYLQLIQQSPMQAGGILELACGFGKTIMALWILAHLKKKTLIIVNKEFLMNQWKERIEEHLPEARIGIIQGSMVDIDNKDIVLGMLQSISMKTYDSMVFDSFGFTIIDECHHISSEVFSCALFKIVTRYMLSLSATLTRQDGTRYVLEYFLGNTVYQSISPHSHEVIVRAIEYTTLDEEFQEIIYDYRGLPQYSSMITKVCNYRPRTEFIIRLLHDLLQERPDKQIMVICHQICLLKTLYTLLQEGMTLSIPGHSHPFVYPPFSSCGLYIGGMKQSELDETAKQQVVLCSFALAQEGLDIAGLSTLCMISSKCDIVQTVGRILRKKGEQKIIVDLIDPHSLFKNQWSKRRQYYKQCNYTIYTTTSHQYTSMIHTDGWKVGYQARTKTECIRNSSSQLPQDVHEIETKKCLVDISMIDIYVMEQHVMESIFEI
jgi:superfamily II DNA or RNA helicase